MCWGCVIFERGATKGRESGAGMDGGAGDNGRFDRAAGQVPMVFMEGGQQMRDAVMWQELVDFEEKMCLKQSFNIEHMLHTYARRALR